MSFRISSVTLKQNNVNDSGTFHQHDGAFSTHSESNKSETNPPLHTITQRQER